jgi:hypothetical protein
VTLPWRGSGEPPTMTRDETIEVPREAIYLTVSYPRAVS